MRIKDHEQNSLPTVMLMETAWTWQPFSIAVASSRAAVCDIASLPADIARHVN
jgi:hypothetical protein